MLYNRRKRKEFMLEQQHIHRTAVTSARCAIAAGTASPEQINFMQVEDMLDRVEEERRARPGIFTRGTKWVKESLFSGLKMEDAFVNSGGEILKAVDERKEELMGEMETKKNALQETTGKIIHSAQEAWEKEKKLERDGGLLDQVGLTGDSEKSK